MDHVQSGMSRAKKTIALPRIKNAITVRLDHRTVITLANPALLEFWKKRYPQAQVIG